MTITRGHSRLCSMHTNRNKTRLCLFRTLNGLDSSVTASRSVARSSTHVYVLHVTWRHWRSVSVEIDQDRFLRRYYITDRYLSTSKQVTPCSVISRIQSMRFLSLQNRRRLAGILPCPGEQIGNAVNSFADQVLINSARPTYGENVRPLQIDLGLYAIPSDPIYVVEYASCPARF